jgi:hypothetical protein
MRRARLLEHLERSREQSGGFGRDIHVRRALARFDGLLDGRRACEMQCVGSQRSLAERGI